MKEENNNSIQKQSIQEIIISFNKMYKLPINNKPTVPEKERLNHFLKILREEVKEGEDIIEKLDALGDDMEDDQKADIIADVSDWLGDMIWYIRSEAVKYGIDMDKTLHIIKDSNASKLDENGKPIYDNRGKVMKGPNYWPPEPKIKEFIKQSFNK